jgi:hypothetical protein
MPKYNSISDFIKVQERNWKDAVDPNKVLRAAVVTLVPEIKRRVQNDGKKSDGSQIGEYSDKTITGGPLAARFNEVATKKQIGRRLRAFGDTNEFYGYKDLRRSLGRQVAFVDLTLTGDMFLAFRAAPSGPNSYGYGFAGNQFKIAQYNEERYGTVFDPSDTENKLTLNTINKESTKLLSR